MTAVVDMYTRYTNYAETYDAEWWIEHMNKHPEVPVATCVAYVIFVFAGQAFMKNREPLPLKWLIVGWNLFLAVFSIGGAIVFLPYFADIIYNKGFHYAMCEPPQNWFYKGPTGIWINLFVASKIPEMFDTVLLVFGKKPVILLHWYHHASVMLFAWNSWWQPTAPSVWFAAMNYFVHALMYSYYFMMSLSATSRKMVRPFAQMITTLQLTQMVFGLWVSLTACYFIHFSETPCEANAFNNTFACVMYGSYLVLFSKLFYSLYLSPDAKKKKKAKAAAKKIA